jgi:hypothetical protein
MNTEKIGKIIAGFVLICVVIIYAFKLKKYDGWGTVKNVVRQMEKDTPSPNRIVNEIIITKKLSEVIRFNDRKFRDVTVNGTKFRTWAVDDDVSFVCTYTNDDTHESWDDTVVSVNEARGKKLSNDFSRVGDSVRFRLRPDSKREWAKIKYSLTASQQ